MISFKQYLQEARMAPLYHGTGNAHILQILKNGLTPTTSHMTQKMGNNKRTPEGIDQRTYGVSLTRNLNFAISWGHFVIELDQQKLAQRFKIVPFQYFQTPSKYGKNNKPARSTESLGIDSLINNEYEEFVVTKNNIPPSMFVRVYVRRGFAKHLAVQETIDKIRQKYGKGFVVIING